MSIALVSFEQEHNSMEVEIQNCSAVECYYFCSLVCYLYISYFLICITFLITTNVSFGELQANIVDALFSE